MYSTGEVHLDTGSMIKKIIRNDILIMMNVLLISYNATAELDLI